MTKKLFIAALAVLVLLGGSSFVQKKENAASSFSGIIAEAQAASADYFLKLDGIDGESTDDKHKNEIEVLSWSWGASNAGTSAGGGGGGAGKVSMQDFHFTSSVDKATPKLMLAVAKGEHIREAVLTARKGSGKGEMEYLTIKLENVMVSSLQVDGSSGQLPTEQFSLNYQKIEWTYTAADGTIVTGGWDVAGNIEI